MAEPPVINGYQIRASAKTVEYRLGLTLEEAIKLGDEHTVAVQTWLSMHTPQAKCFDGLGTIAVDSGMKVLNRVPCCNYPPRTSSEAVEDEIIAIKSIFARRNVQWDWWLGPNFQPSDMAHRLERHGLKSDAYRLPTLIAPLLSMAEYPVVNPAVEVWPAATRADLQAASTIRRIAFRWPLDTALTYFDDMAADWLNSDLSRLYLARVSNGPPAAIGALVMGVGVPGIYVMATLPEWQGQGLGTAIMARLMAQAEAEGHKWVVLTAGRMGYNIYRRFGFEHLFEYQIFRYVPGRCDRLLPT